MHHMVFVVGDDVEEQMNGLFDPGGLGFCDAWMIGGRYVGALPDSDQARLGDIDLSALPALPSAVVMGGEVVLEKYSTREQAQAVLKRLEALPADTLITVVDVHS
jgi:hypothetical protein